MTTKDRLGDRMKGYEMAARTTLPRRMPLIIRVDGKSFHTYTRDCDRPFDWSLSNAMGSTAVRLCEEIQGAQMAYTQSDEISILVHNYKRLESQPWHSNQVQKMVSVAAGIASSYFTVYSEAIFEYVRAAVFDARAFVLPEAEVTNYFLWRQQDAMRNSIQMLARSLYSHGSCNHKNTDELRAMCGQKGVIWGDLDMRWRRGFCVVRRSYGSVVESEGSEPASVKLEPDVSAPPRWRWEEDFEIPYFGEDRNYVDRFLAVEEE